MQRFHAFAQTAALVMGSPWYLLGILAVILLTPLVGGWFGAMLSSLVVLTYAFTVTTEIKATLVLYTEHHERRALHLKLDNLTQAIAEASNAFVQLERKPPSEVERIAGEGG